MFSGGDRIMNPQLEQIVSRIREVPSLPDVLMEVLQAIDRTESSIDDIARAIKRDQSLTVNILKVANSAFYGLLGKVSTVRQAIVLIGFRELRNIVLAQSVFRFYSVESRTDFRRQDLWTHSTVCGFLAKRLAKEAFAPDPAGAAMVCGLIHDIGKVVIDRYFHEEFIGIIQLVRDEEVTFSEAEQRVLGYTHAHIGATLLKRWNFPRELVCPVLYHHAPWKDTEYAQISAVVYYANLLSKALKYPSYQRETAKRPSLPREPALLAFLEKSGLPVRRMDVVAFLRTAYSRIQTESSSVIGAMSIPNVPEDSVQMPAWAI